jgi:uncharacterized protein (TIGR02452 family)
MQAEHLKRQVTDSTDWAMLSPELHVFRSDDGTELESLWLLSFITCAAPCAPDVGQPESGNLLQERIHRVLAIAHAYGCSCLVLGACGCGAFENDPRRTAEDFRSAIDNGRGFGESFGGMLGASPMALKFSGTLQKDC